MRITTPEEFDPALQELRARLTLPDDQGAIIQAKDSTFPLNPEQVLAAASVGIIIVRAESGDLGEALLQHLKDVYAHGAEVLKDTTSFMNNRSDSTPHNLK